MVSAQEMTKINTAGIIAREELQQFLYKEFGIVSELGEPTRSGFFKKKYEYPLNKDQKLAGEIQIVLDRKDTITKIIALIANVGRLLTQDQKNILKLEISKATKELGELEIEIVELYTNLNSKHLLEQ
jgi:hypothetical protein